jgi:hypothetical protein
MELASNIKNQVKIQIQPSYLSIAQFPLNGLFESAAVTKVAAHQGRN